MHVRMHRLYGDHCGAFKNQLIASPSQAYQSHHVECCPSYTYCSNKCPHTNGKRMMSHKYVGNWNQETRIRKNNKEQSDLARGQLAKVETKFRSTITLPNT